MASEVFLSYRSDDEPGFAQQLFHHLKIRLGPGVVFMDVKEISAGEDWLRSITNALTECTVFLAVLGPRWVDLMDELRDSTVRKSVDFVRYELSYAIAAGKRLIPVLVRGASLPASNRLPGELQGLLQHQARNLRSDNFEQDALLLAGEIETFSGATSGRTQPLNPTLDERFYGQLVLVDSMVGSVLKEWREHGTEASAGRWEFSAGMPRHPELVYRISGDWKGWNDFLGVSSERDPHAFAKNEMQDRIERLAFDRLVSVLGEPPSVDGAQKPPHFGVERRK